MTSGPDTPDADVIEWSAEYEMEPKSDQIRDSPCRFELRYDPSEYPDGDIKRVIGELDIDADLPDPRDEAHPNYLLPNPWVRAHILREAMGWGTEALKDYFEDNPYKAVYYGFFGTKADGRLQPRPPSQSYLHELWDHKFAPDLKTAIREIAAALVELARENDIPAPVPACQVEDKPADLSTQSQKRLAIDTAVPIWERIRRFVNEYYYTKRADNAHIPEPVFWKLHTHASIHEDMAVGSGAHSLYAKGWNWDLWGTTQRYHLMKYAVDEIREMFRDVTREFIRIARRDGAFDRGVPVAIDITRGNPWTGERLTNDVGETIEPWILGYKDGEFYFQWASIQIIGLNIPFVLDAIPVPRRMPREEIVDELLDNATDMVNINQVMMDRQFDKTAIKQVCHEHGVLGLNGAKRQGDKKKMAEKMEGRDEPVLVTECDEDAPSDWKRIYVPSIKNDDDEDEADEDGAEKDDADESEEISDQRQEMLDAIGLTPEDMEDDEVSPLEGLLEGIYRVQERHEADGESDDEDDGGDSITYVVFETNDPELELTEGVCDQNVDEDQMRAHVRAVMQWAARQVRLYRLRWGIENGYKKLKKFRVKSRSKKHRYRFFNFTFACLLYNVWRIVDLLVKLAVQDDPDNSPIITAETFLSIAESHFGVGPPPPD